MKNSMMTSLNGNICHQMETYSVLLVICAGNSPVTGKFPAQRPVTRSFDFFFDLRLIKRLNKQSRGWWFKTPSPPLWRHCNEIDNDDFCNWLAEPFRQQTLELLLCRIVYIYIYIYICIYMYVYIYKVNIWNVNCAQASAFIFDSRTDVLMKVSKFLRQKMSRHQRDSSSQTSDSCRMAWPFEISGPGISYSL